ncbi:MAG: exodeoxyribonuclease V subunit gamma [Acidimicrobiia bacterium]
MSFHLTVGGSLEPLADALADLLAVPAPGADPFEAELVLVPSAGVRAWLGACLARRLGATARGGDGVVANIDWQFPGRVVTVALGPDAGLGTWETDRLTWAVFDELVDDAARFGQPVDAVRARAIADLFDSYTLRRPTMVLGWERDSDQRVGGRPVPDAQRWQPELWRAVRDRLGGRSDVDAMRQMLGRLRDGDVAAVPARLVVFGLAALPPPHLELLGALSVACDVYVFAPVPSGTRWRRLVDRLPTELELPIPRDESSLFVVDGHPLVSEWGRAAAEAHALLHATAVGAGATVTALLDDSPLTSDTLLHRLQHDIVTDTAPPGAPRRGATDERMVMSADDDSVRWLQCYGAARQVEVLRDAILHLLAETDADGSPRYAPRDIAVLTPDIARYAPLVESTFAGDEAHGVPAIPLEVADRTLRQDNPLVDALLQLFELTEGRFRVTDVLRFAGLPVVARRFGLDANDLERIATWIDATNVRWGIDTSDLERFGVPAVYDAFTWRSALDQLLLGAAVPDGAARLGLGEVPPFPGIEGDGLLVAGRFAELVRAIAAAVDRLTIPAPVADWCAGVGQSISSLFRPGPDDAWTVRAVERALSDLTEDAASVPVTDERVVEPGQLLALARVKLESGSGRARFGTGAVTLSSLTAQRGVPFRVVCLLGLDSEAGAIASAENLLATRPCIGDRDARTEQRAQLLDAVLAAGDRLIVCSNGHDVRTNTELPPVALLADLLDVIDATAVSADGTAASASLAIAHPRQSWSEVSFLPGTLGLGGPWGFDTGALAAVRARNHQTLAEPFLPEPLGPVPDDDLGQRVTVDELVRAITEPVRAFLSRRLGVSLVDTDGGVDDDSIPLTLDDVEQSSLERWLLAERLQVGNGWTDDDLDERLDVARRRGIVPPGELGDAPLDQAVHRVDSAVALAAGCLDLDTPAESVPVRVEVTTTGSPPVLIEGTIGGVHGDVVLDLRVSRIRPAALLSAWLHVALLVCTDPSRYWQVLLVGRPGSDTKGGSSAEFVTHDIHLIDPERARAVVNFAVDMWRRSQCDALPFFSATSRAVHNGDVRKAKSLWHDSFNGYGDRLDRWVRLVFDIPFDELAALERRSDEPGDDPRLRWWADRVWSLFDETCHSGSAIDESAEDR